MDVVIELPRPHPGQQEVLDSNARFKVLCWGRRAGKTLICQLISITRMLKNQHIAYVCPEYGLAKDFYKEVLKYLPKEIVVVDNKSELYIELITGGSIKFFSGNSLDNFRGRKYHLVIIDEAAYIPGLEDFWFGAIRPTISDYEGEAIFISTPRGKNFFHSIFLKGKNKEDEFESWQMSTDQNPYFPRNEFESARQTLPAAKFNEEYLAIPGENSDGAFQVEDIKAGTVQVLSTAPTIVYGIDLARTGDWTVIIGLDANGNTTYFQRFRGSWEQTYEKVKALPGNVLKVVDATGVGSVIHERLLTAGVQNLQGFVFTQESKANIIYALVKAVELGQVTYPEAVANEMFVFQFKHTATGALKFEAQAGYHDDCIMALAMAVYHKKKAEQAKAYKLWAA